MSRGHPLPAPPGRTFASDNASGVHPAVMDAIVRANHGHALAYGDDDWTRAAVDAFREQLEHPVEVLFVWGGTGANVVALATMLHGTQAVICTDAAHIHVDEAGAPERFTGAKLVAVAAPDGKLRPEHIREQQRFLGEVHHVQPHVVSITQSTERGTLYTVDEIGAICETAHEFGMLVHLDGARIANAVAALDTHVRAVTIDAGVDVISFGGTKNGMMYGEAIVFADETLAARARFVQKQATQLPSKVRFIAAQFSALLSDGLWLDLARHSNAMARRLHDAVAPVEGVVLDGPPAVNSLFPRLPVAAVAPLQAWCPFYVWDEEPDWVRWMTTWDTSARDVDTFAAGVAAVVGQVRASAS